jgi:hypothetical protein
MRRVLVATIALAASACGRIAGLDDVHAVTGPELDAAAGSDAPADLPTPTCTGAATMVADEGFAHMPDESAIAWNANPPASGTHYDDWVAWDRTYTKAIKRGYWVHNLEHGGIVLLYNCSDCQADIDRLTAFVESSPIDASCSPPIKRKMIVVPDPLLPAGVSFAATAWHFAYTASCVNEAELRVFADAHYGHGPEDICNQGAFTP